MTYDRIELQFSIQESETVNVFRLHIFILYFFQLLTSNVKYIKKQFAQLFILSKFNKLKTKPHAAFYF